jgi:O-antigen/teichoic acid export membrane protein
MSPGARAPAVTAGPASGPPFSDLSSQAVRGGLWTVLGFGASQGIRLAGNLVLARLLFPEAFGLVGLVNTFLIGAVMFSDLGIATSIVRSPRGDDPRFLATAWTLQALRGLVLFGAVAALSGPLGLLLDGLVSTAFPRLTRRLELKRLAGIELAAQVAGLVAMVAWVLASPTVWALVAGGLVAAGAKLLLSHLAIDDVRQRVAWDPEAARELLHFGGWIFVSTLLQFLVKQSDRLIFGKLLPLGLFGVYNIALMLAMLPALLLGRLGASVLFPALSSATRDGRELAAVLGPASRPLLLLGGLTASALAAGAVPLIDLLYDPRYADAGWMLVLLAVGAWFETLQVPSGSALLVLGAPRWLAVASAVKLAAIAAFVPLGYAMAGVQGGILGFVAAEGVRWLTLAIGAHRFHLDTLGADLRLSLRVLLGAALGQLAAEAATARAGDLAGLLAGVAVASLPWLPPILRLLGEHRGRLREAIAPRYP